MYSKKIINIVDQMDILIFLSFGGYIFFSFETQTNHMICTKVRNISPSFGINFSIRALENIRKTSNFWRSSTLVPCPAQHNTHFLPEPHSTYTPSNPQTHTTQQKPSLLWMSSTSTLSINKKTKLLVQNEVQSANYRSSFLILKTIINF